MTPTEEELKMYFPYFAYLVELRDSGVTNMYGAPKYLMAEYGLDKATAIKITTLWMKSFEEDE